MIRMRLRAQAVSCDPSAPFANTVVVGQGDGTEVVVAYCDTGEEAALVAKALSDLAEDIESVSNAADRHSSRAAEALARVFEGERDQAMAEAKVLAETLDAAVASLAAADALAEAIARDAYGYQAKLGAYRAARDGGEIAGEST